MRRLEAPCSTTVSSVCGIYLLLEQHQTMHTLGHNDGPAVEDERRENREREGNERGELLL